MNNQTFLSVENICKKFRLGGSDIEVLRGVSFTVEQGRWIALLGASGSGKTTLLDIIGSISVPDAGTVVIDGIETAKLSVSSLVSFRRKNVGFVFQAYHILPELNVLENIMLPALLDGMSRHAAKEKATKLLEQVGLAHRQTHRPNELSGGEQQRTAIARSLVNSPRLLLADEPTGNLDSVTGSGILELFKNIRAVSDTTIIMVTHDRNVATLADEIIELKDGMIATHDE